MYRAFQGPNGWYVAFEDGQGVHHQPRDGGELEEGEARDQASRLNERAEHDDENDYLHA